jgi:hypothetical protein
MGIWDSFTDERETEEINKRGATCPQEGGLCPTCREGSLAYNGKLELVCPHCQAVFGAGFS